MAALNLGQIKRLHWHGRPDTGEALRKRSLKREKEWKRKKSKAVRISAFMLHFNMFKCTSLALDLPSMENKSVFKKQNKEEKKKPVNPCKPKTIWEL